MKERPGAERLQTHTDTETETDRESPAGQPSQLMWPSGAEAIKTAAMLQSSAVALEGRCQQLLKRVQTLQEEKSRLHNQVRVCVPVPVPVPVSLSYSLPLSLSLSLSPCLSLSGFLSLVLSVSRPGGTAAAPARRREGESHGRGGAVEGHLEPCS